MATKHKFGIIKSVTSDITPESMQIDVIENTPELPSNNNEVVLFINESNDLMLTTLNYNNTTDTLLKGTLKQL
jgi:hypothetical protein